MLVTCNSYGFQTKRNFQESRINEALELLSPLEKLSRIGSDMKSNSRLVRSMVKLTFDSKNYDLFGETIKSLCKKRSLIKYSIKCMVFFKIKLWWDTKFAR